MGTPTKDHDLTIRRATADDASFLAWVMLTASRSHLPFGLWEQFVKGSKIECLNFLEKIVATQTPHLFQYEVFLIADNDGRPVAGLSGYDPDTHGIKMFAKALSEIYNEIGWTQTDIANAFSRLSSYGACAPAEAPGIWTVESVASVPEFRRQGIIHLLLKEIIAKGKAKGFNQAQIAVLISNRAARKAYEKCGFHYVDEKRDPDFEATYGDYGIARLILDLF